MAFPLPIKEQPGLAVDGIVTDANGDHWILFPDQAYWHKFKKEEMAQAIDRYLQQFGVSNG